MRAPLLKPIFAALALAAVPALLPLLARSGNDASAPPAVLAVTGAPDAASAARAQLRAQGYRGLAAFERTWTEDLAEAPPSPEIREALDAVCAQKDCWASRLYWHTDLDAAKRRAAATGKPILSLRLLGRLDEERSCANSRFFRTVLYANEEVSRLLREEFVLHWKPAGPIPKVRIEIGDRVMERTLTGNSVHYVLDAGGRVLDALPGLYGPEVFRAALAPHVRATRPLPASLSIGKGGPLRAERAVALSKMAVEVAPLRRVTPRADAPDLKPGDPDADRYLAREVIPVLGRQSLDPGSRRLFLAKLRAGGMVGDPALDDLDLALERFETSLTWDTAFNETFFRPRILSWIDAGMNDPETLNDRVYRELFETPLDDPWLGLVPPNVYAALDGNGLARLR